MLSRLGLQGFIVSLAVVSFALAQDCNPTSASCPAIPGLATSSYFVDFSQHSSLPANWVQANYENVTYGLSGAEFTFAQRRDAPYIWTNFYILFGHVEVVMQAAPGIGIISSAVLISDDLDEIDWEFSGNNFGDTSGKVQTNYFGKGITGNYDRGSQPPVSSPQTQFHTYTLDWSASALVWSIDGTAIRELQNTNAGGSHQYPQTPMRLHLGLWDGGDPDTNAGTAFWAGGYTDLSKAPFTMYVKSVKITTANPCNSFQYTDLSGSWQSIRCINDTTATSSSSSSSALFSSSAPSLTSSSTSPPTSPLLQSTSDRSAVPSTSTTGSVGHPQSSAATPTINISSDIATLSNDIHPQNTTLISGTAASSRAVVSGSTSISTPSTSTATRNPDSSSASSLPTLLLSWNLPFSTQTANPAPATSTSEAVVLPASGYDGTGSADLRQGSGTPAVASNKPSNVVIVSNSTAHLTYLTLNSTTTTTTTAASVTSTSSTSIHASPSTTMPSTPIISSSTHVASTTSTPPPPTKLVCNQDNCLRNLLDSRYSQSASSLCRTYTVTSLAQSQAIPTYLGGCAAKPSRVSSACSCLMSMATVTSAPPIQPSLQSSGGQLHARRGGGLRQNWGPFFAWR